MAVLATLLVLPTACTQIEAAVRVSNAVDTIREAGSPLVHGAYVDSGDARIMLSKDAGERQARTVWCELLIPNGLDPSNATLYSFDHSRTWPMPADC